MHGEEFPWIAGVSERSGLLWKLLLVNTVVHTCEVMLMLNPQFLGYPDEDRVSRSAEDSTRTRGREFRRKEEEVIPYAIGRAGQPMTDEETPGYNASKYNPNPTRGRDRRRTRPLAVIGAREDVMLSITRLVVVLPPTSFVTHSEQVRARSAADKLSSRNLLRRGHVSEHLLFRSEVHAIAMISVMRTQGFISTTQVSSGVCGCSAAATALVSTGRRI